MKSFSILVMIFSFFLSGCVISRSPSTKSVDLDKIDFSDIETMKKGKDCSYNFLFIPFGNPTLFDATKDARIKKVRYVENSFSGFPFVFIPVFSKHCITAYGE